MPTWDGWSVGEIIGQVSEAHNHGCVGGPVLNDADITLTTGRQQPWVGTTFAKEWVGTLSVLYSGRRVPIHCDPAETLTRRGLWVLTDCL